MRFDCAIFDLDGTLLDSQQMWTQAKTGVVTHRGFSVSEAEKAALMAMEFPELTHALSHNWPTGITPEQAMQEIAETVAWHYARTIQPKKGIPQLLERLHSLNIPCCLATASWEERFMPVLRRLELDKQLDHIVTSAMVGRDKHFADVYLEAARRCGAQPCRSVVFEDTLYSIRAAKQAGFMVVGINEPDSDGTAEELRSVCDWFVDDVTQLPPGFWEE